MKKKILFVIYSIHGGGAQRQMQYILKHIDREKFEPHLAVFQLTGKENEVVPPDVIVYDLSTAFRPASFFLFFKLIGLIKKIMPDKILSFMWGVNIISVMAGKVANIKVIVSERIFTPLSIKKYSFEPFRRWLISFLYRKADNITAVSEDVKNGLIDYFSLPEEKIEIIYNGVDIKKIHGAMGGGHPPAGNYVLGCGSLEKKKNFDLLLKAVSEIPDLKLVILGEGTEKENLEKQAVEAGVDLELPGFDANPYTWMRKAKVFVLSSQYEGFPNVVLEAMACGCPVVSVDCPGGIREIIENEKNGIIVPRDDSAAMAKGIKKILVNPVFAKTLTDEAVETVKKFDVFNMVNKYENMLGKQV